MEFFTVNGKRPVRLCGQTRKFAWESLNHRYGLDTMAHPAVVMDDVPGFGEMTPIQQYDAILDKIVREAPVRICEGELVSGAATLGMAIRHRVPAEFEGRPVFESVSHLTLDFPSVLRYGTIRLEQMARESVQRWKGTEREPFAQSCVHTLDCLNLWHDRYMEALKNRPGMEENVRYLQNVPRYPAKNFREAVQSIWFVFAFTRLCGNWPGIGRLDAMLGPYLEQDLRNGTLTLDQAREILAHMFIKGCEWICGGDYGSGDAQHYQNIVLGGIDREGREVTNEVTGLVLDIWEELGISDFPTTVRLNSRTDERFLRRLAEVMRLGGGILAVYNEDLVLSALTEYGYDPLEAREFANDGCWEVQIPGKTNFGYYPFDSLAVLQKRTLKSYDGSVSFPDFEALYQQYLRDLQKELDGILDWKLAMFRDPSHPVEWKPAAPCTAVSLFEQGCLERGLSYQEGGPVYQILSPHIGGIADTVNSLCAIRKLVYEDRKVSFADLMEILKNNWEGAEALRQYALNKGSFYGNDQAPADQLAARLVSDFADLCDRLNGKCPCRFPGGISTFGRQIEWAPNRLATPYGRRAGEVLAGNASPTPGTDRKGATAIIRSYCRPDLKRMVTGAALDLRLLPSAVNGEDGLQALVGLMQGFVALGGFFMQPDVEDGRILREAQLHPEDYQNLSVRVSGWNARFVTLNRQWQDMLIAQVES